MSYHDSHPLFRYLCLFLILPGLALLYASAAYTATTLPMDKIVAIVDDTVIADSALHQRIQAVTYNLKQTHQPLPQPAQLRQQVLQHMIEEQLQLNIANAHHIVVSDQAVDAVIRKMAARNHLDMHAFKRAVYAHTGTPYTAYYQHIKNQMRIAQLHHAVLAGKIHVEKKEIEAQLKIMRAQERTVKTAYHLWDALVPFEQDDPPATRTAKNKATAWQKKAQAGTPLSALIPAAYQDKQPGDLGFRRLDELPVIFKAVVPTLKPKQASAPIKAGNGYHVLQLLEKRTPKIQISRQAAKVQVFEKKFSHALSEWLENTKSMTYIKVIP